MTSMNAVSRSSALGGWLLMAFVTMLVTVIAGHDLAYLAARTQVDATLHAYFAPVQLGARLALVGGVLWMLRRICAPGGMVDGWFVRRESHRARVASLAYRGGLLWLTSTVALIAQELGERAMQGYSAALPSSLVLAVVFTQFVLVAVVLLVPTWARRTVASVQEIIARVRRRRVLTAARSSGVDHNWVVTPRVTACSQSRWLSRARGLRGSPCAA